MTLKMQLYFQYGKGHFLLMKVLQTYNCSNRTSDRLNLLAIWNVHFHIHTASQDVLQRFIALNPYMLDRLGFNI